MLNYKFRTVSIINTLCSILLCFYCVLVNHDSYFTLPAILSLPVQASNIEMRQFPHMGKIDVRDKWLRFNAINRKFNKEITKYVSFLQPSHYNLKLNDEK